MLPFPKIHARDLVCIEQLMREGSLEDALHEVERLENVRGLEEDVRLASKLLKSRILILKDNLEKGLQLAEEVFEESQGLGKQILVLETIVLIADVSVRRIDGLHPYWSLERLMKHLQVIEKGEHLLRTLPHLTPLERAEREAWLKRCKGIIYWVQKELDHSLQCLQASLALYKKIGNREGMAEVLVRSAFPYRDSGEVVQALECLEKSLVTYEEIGHKEGVALSLCQIGKIYLKVYEKSDLGLEYFEKSLATYEELGNKAKLAEALIWIGLYCRINGELDRALEYQHQSLAISEKQGDQPNCAEALSEIGIVYRDKGESNLAIKYLRKSLAIAEKLGTNPHLISWLLANIGFVSMYQGHLEDALQYMLKGLKIREELGIELFLGHSFFFLVELSLEMGNHKAANEYLERLREINESINNRVADQSYRLAQAMILKASPRTRDKMRAQDLFLQVTEEPVLLHELTEQALLHLCELLLFEFKTSETPEILHEIKTVTRKLLELATAQRSPFLLAQTYMFQSKLALVELDVKGARQLLEQAQYLAEEKGLKRLAMNISSEHDALLEQLSQWEDFIARNVSLAERAELAHLEEQVVRMIRKRMEELPQLPQEEPELVLIIGADSGLSVFSKSFREDQPLADQLVAGFLTAINALVRDAFAATGSIERIKHQEHTLLLQAVEPFLVSYVFQGPSYFALKKLNQFIEALQASPVVWKALTEALQTRRFVAKGNPVEALVSEIFLPVSTVSGTEN